MKKTIIIALMAILPFGAFAQKFGHVNTADIIPMMSEFKSAQAEMEELVKQYKEELDYMQGEYQKKYEDYMKNRETMPESILSRREEELMDSRDKIQQYYETCEINKNQREAELMDAINTKVLKAIQTVGEEGGYVCVFNIAGGVVPYVSSTLTTDVTEEVKAKLGIK
jgi:outer membrane protein